MAQTSVDMTGLVLSRWGFYWTSEYEGVPQSSPNPDLEKKRRGSIAKKCTTNVFSWSGAQS